MSRLAAARSIGGRAAGLRLCGEQLGLRAGDDVLEEPVDLVAAQLGDRAALRRR